MAELAEVLIFREWAWTARGQSTADEVSGQAWALFEHRSQMAQAALDALRPTAGETPVWHDLSIDVALDISEDNGRIREIYDHAVGQFPDYLPIHASMLRVLMPRWTGSFEAVDELIKAATSRGTEQDLELYARLYWTYFLLEQDDVDIFVDAKASWTNVDVGFAGLIERYPRSDYLLNAYAVMACLARDRERYAELRQNVQQRMSAIVWSDKYSLDKCDRQMRLQK